MATSGPFDRWDTGHSWHPFSQMQEYCAWPRVQIDRGEGCWLYDTEGKAYLDGNASVWTNTFGHNDADLNAALQTQLGKVAHTTYLGMSHPVAATLGHALCQRAPGSLERVFFSDNGSNAIEIALKMSYQYWQLNGQPQRKRIIGMAGGYHGDTIGTMAAGQSGRFHERFSAWFPDCWHFPAPECDELNGRIRHQSMERSLETLERYLTAEASQVACLVLEPSVQGAAGMVQQPPGFVKALAALCRHHQVHLILDEVFVAFGRLGGLFAADEESVEPDFLCLAKGLSAGYLPLAATLVQSRIYEAFLGKWSADRTFFHGHTFTANPLGCAVALKNLEKLEALMHSGRLTETIANFGARLAATFDGHPNVKCIRQRGLTGCIELQPSAGRPAWHADARMGWQVALHARANGLILRPLGDSLLVVPTLIISPQEIDYLCAQALESIEAVAGSE